MDSWALAFGMMLLFEGILPFLFPRQWREAFERITRYSNGQIRFYGLIALLCGMAVMLLARFLL
jgi:uncharacterized protein YjeT (DUF2065 family)